MRALACLVCVFAIGCGGGGGGNGGSGGTGGGGAAGGGGGAGGAGGGGGGGGAMVAVTGNVHTSGNGGTPSPIAGATVAIAGTSTSTTTAADGSFTLMAAAGSTLFVTASLTNYESSEFGFVVPAAGGALPQMQLLTNAEVTAATASLSPPLTIDSQKGVVVVQFKDSVSTAGYAAMLSASHGNSFSPDSGMYTTSTPGNSNDSDNPLVFPNVVAGMTTVAITPASGKTCTADQAITNWRVEANAFTWIIYNCQ